MTYTGEGYKEKKVEVGKRVDDEVTAIKEGKLSSFVKNWDTFDKKGQSDPNQPSIEISTQAGASVLIALPKTKEYHPKSKFGKWVKTYGKPPHIGQKITSAIDENGFYRVMLM